MRPPSITTRLDAILTTCLIQEPGFTTKTWTILRKDAAEDGGQLVDVLIAFDQAKINNCNSDIDTLLVFVSLVEEFMLVYN